MAVIGIRKDRPKPGPKVKNFVLMQELDKRGNALYGGFPGKMQSSAISPSRFTLARPTVDSLDRGDRKTITLLVGPHPWLLLSSATAGQQKTAKAKSIAKGCTVLLANFMPSPFRYYGW